MAVKDGSNIWLMLAGSLVNALVDKSFETTSGFSGILVNGVEILNYKVQIVNKLNAVL